MSNQISEKSKKSYKQDSSSNAVKLLSKVDNFNGYIRVYTELNSNFKKDDVVYISSKFNVKHTGSTLDNFIENNLDDDYPYVDYASGYKVLKVKNNEIIIDRLYQFDNELTLQDHYISKISFNIGNFNKGKLNSILFKQVEMHPVSITDITFNQAIILSGTVMDTLILDKYDSHYMSQNGEIENNSNKITYSFNNSYGYNYFENIKFIECDFQNGYYNNCILTTEGDSDVSNYSIENGYYDTSSIFKHNINGGYMKNCDLNNTCIWNNGTWNDDNDGFNLLIWNDGIWVNGIFANKIWYNGEFKSGTFSASTWHDGTFNGSADRYFTPTTPSNFYNSIWKDGIYNGGTFSQSQWFKGIFNNGYISDSRWSDGTFNNGNLKRTEWITGIFNGGNFGIDDTSLSLSKWYRGRFNGGNIKANWHSGYFNGGIMRESTWIDGTFTNGIFYKSTWTDGIWFNGTLNQSTWLDGLWNNGLVEDSDIDGGGEITPSNWYSGDWYNGIAKSGTFHNVNWSGGTATLDAHIGSTISDSDSINWYDGSFSGKEFGWSTTPKGDNNIDIEWISKGQKTETIQFVTGKIDGPTAQDSYEKIQTAIGHGMGFESFYLDKTRLMFNIRVFYPFTNIMTFYGEAYSVAPKKDFTLTFGPVPINFTGNWYGGQLYSGTFMGKWYNGQYYNSTWLGQNMNNYFFEPDKYANQDNTSIYNAFNEDFVQQNINTPPETNLFNPQNQGFQDPTYFN